MLSVKDKRQTWIDFHTRSATADANRGAVWNDCYNLCNSAVKEIVDQEAELLNFMLSNQVFDLSLIPGAEKGSVMCIHNCFAHEDPMDGSQSLIGLKGAFFSSPWKSTSTKPSVAQLKTPQQTRSKPTHFPALEEFLKCAEPTEFAELVGNSEGRNR